MSSLPWLPGLGPTPEAPAYGTASAGSGLWMPWLEPTPWVVTHGAEVTGAGSWFPGSQPSGNDIVDNEGGDTVGGIAPVKLLEELNEAHDRPSETATGEASASLVEALFPSSQTKEAKRNYSPRDFSRDLRQFKAKTDRQVLQELGDGFCGYRAVATQVFGNYLGMECAAACMEQLEKCRKFISQALQNHSRTIVDALTEEHKGHRVGTQVI
jgi:hypothetical protein